MTKLSNGDILFPIRGGPPENPDPEKYERDTGDLYIFHLKLPDCVNRVERPYIRPKCNKVQIVKGCLITNQPVDYMTCMLCEHDKTIKHERGV